ncbi:MAG TPA: peptidase M3, partial [Acidobacteria bacterium]|nr:peptidase M3 [Acidobacteriota bacterium]
MHNGTIVLALAAMVVLGACTAHQPPASRENPLLGQWNTPFQAPPFDKITPEDFGPAFEVAMKAHDREISAIVSNPEPPSFANTVEALERSGQLLERVRLVFMNLNQADSTPELQALARKINPELSSHEDGMLMNAGLFNRIQKVWNDRENLNLTEEQQRLLEKQHREFVQGGAELDEASKARLKKINGELSSLSTRFEENLLKEMNRTALLITDEKDLDGLPQSVRDSAAALAKAGGHEGAWAFNLQRTSWTPFLRYSTRRELRKKLYTAYTHLCANGGETDNRGIAARIASLRVERAHLLGYPSHAAYVLDGDTMAEKPENVFGLLDKVWPASLDKAKEERAALQALANRLGDHITLKSWDWWYYAEKLRAEKYDFDESSVKPYLQLDRVRQAAFDVANKLWGI